MATPTWKSAALPIRNSLYNALYQPTPRQTKKKLGRDTISSSAVKAAANAGKKVFSDEQILAIRRGFEKEGKSYRELSIEFNSTYEKIYQVMQYTTRGHLVP